MDTGKRKEDYQFYNGYEGEKELILSLPELSVHIWDGYIDDIFGNPIPSNDGWSGFTRDYNEFVGPYENDCIEVAILPDEYIEDAVRYKEREFEFEETRDVLDRILSLLKTAKDADICLLVSVKG